MKVQVREYDEFIEWHYKKMHVLAMQGMCHVPLNEWDKQRIRQGMKFSQVSTYLPQNESAIDFLAMFSRKDLIEVNAAREYRGDTSIITYGTNRDKALTLIEKIRNKTGFIPTLPSQRLRDSLEICMIGNTLDNYNLAEKISALTDRPVENVFAHLAYQDFLKTDR